MCKSISEGGTRCLGHQAGSVATKRYVSAKLNITDKEVGGVISELNREGKNLPAPSKQEVEGWVAREEFKTKLDPEISEHDRKIILKNYQKTREQLDSQGVTGGAFHAWKNAFARAYDKFRRNIRAVTAGGLVVLALAGCGQQAGPTPSADPTTGPVATETAEPTTPVETPAETPGNSGLVDQYPDDSSIPLAEVTDEHGTYTHVTVDPNSPLGQFDPSKVVGDLSAHGFTEDDARRAHELATRFFVEHTLDNPTMDNSSSTVGEWYQENGSTLLTSDYSASDFSGDTSSNSLVPSNMLPQGLIRDGQQRTAISGGVSSITATTNENGNSILSVTVAGQGEARLTDQQVVEQWARPILGDRTDALFQEQYPQYLDGVDDGGIRIEMRMTYNFTSDSISQGQIAGHKGEGTADPM